VFWFVAQSNKFFLGQNFPFGCKANPQR